MRFLRKTSFTVAAAENLKLGVFDCPLDKRLEIEAVLCGFNIGEDRSCLGVLRRKYGAAVLIRLDRCFKGVYPTCDLNDLGLL